MIPVGKVVSVGLRKVITATEVAEVLRDLSVIKMGKELSFGERKMLDMAKTLLVTEICIATDTDEAAVETRLDALFAAPPEGDGGAEAVAG
jgi:RNA polymerase-interacting CarD/CdnL/TRCF family regulator